MKRLANLRLVDELCQGDIRVRPEHMEGLEILRGAVLEFEAQEIAKVGRGAAAEFDG